MEQLDIERQSQTSSTRILTQLENQFSKSGNNGGADWRAFQARCKRVFPRIFHLYFQLYGSLQDFDDQLDDLFAVLCVVVGVV